ncbi:MAG: DMT family transporter [Hyphomicrobiaceae bacterium]
MLAATRRWTDRLYQYPVLLLTLTSLFWAGNAIASRLAVGQITPLSIVFLRWIMVMGMLWPLYGADVRAHWPVLRPHMPRIALMGSLGFTGFNVLFYLSAYYTSAINIGILQGALPVFVIAGAFLVHGTRSTPIQLTGVFITMVGVIVIATGGAPLSILDIGLNRGDLFMIIACALYAFYTVALRDRPAVPGGAFFTVLALVAAASSLPLLVIEAMMTGVKMPTLQGWLVAVYVAIFPSCLSQLFYMRGVDLIGPARAGVFINLVPAFSAILAVVMLGEPFAMFHAVALVLVIGGIWLAQRSRPAGGKKA